MTNCDLEGEAKHTYFSPGYFGHGMLTEQQETKWNTLLACLSSSVKEHLLPRGGMAVDSLDIIHLVPLKGLLMPSYCQSITDLEQSHVVPGGYSEESHPRIHTTLTFMTSVVG